MPSLSERLSKIELNRRRAVELLAGSVAAALARCTKPDEEIIPYVDMPEGLLPGEPMRFATTLPLSGYGRGFLAISVDGRPIKIEGNSRHPFSLGATDVFAESEVLSLYDPDRSRGVSKAGKPSNWREFGEAWHGAAGELSNTAGSRFALLTGRVVSPTTLLRIAALKSRFPEMRWYRYEPVNDDSAMAGAQLAFGRQLISLPRWPEADVILCLDANPLGMGPTLMRVARQYAARRGESHNRQKVFVAEPSWTLTGATADERLPLRPEMIPELARAIANEFGANLDEPQLSPQANAFAKNVASQLRATQRRALVVAGERQTPDVHALCHWINEKLSAPVDHLPPQDSFRGGHAQSFLQFADDLRAKRIGTLIILDTNPVYYAPDEFELAKAIAALPFSVQASQYHDETAACCKWHLPLSHPLESWGDLRALDGTASIVQPLIRRLYDTKTCDEILALLSGEQRGNAYDLVRTTWAAKANGSFEEWWRTALHDGVIANSAAQPIQAQVAWTPSLTRTSPQRGLTLTLSPDPSVWDGRFANNAWLQECPKPFTKQVWGNSIHIGPDDAARLGLRDEEVADVAVGKSTRSCPIKIMSGIAEGVISTTWGFGRTKSGLIGTAVGERFFGLNSQHPFTRMLDGVQLVRSAKVITFRSTQGHYRLHGAGKDLFKIESLRAFMHGQRESELSPPTMLNPPPRGDYAWAMVVDTDACIGCNACVVACQAENNVAVVGPEEISRGRDMHWLRVDAYARYEMGAIRQGFEPVPCMHCELAPCEPVCPVEASIHDHQGLNVQVYNRCIGTRFCEANCPYKVRRFNYYAYAGAQAYRNLEQALKPQHNPDVSARERGVMEKCNYCLQRINRARRNAEREDRKIAEGEMVTACQAACPTRAIHFGDLNRADSDVSKLRRSQRHYTLLAELNTRPRTTYLKRIYNSDHEAS